MRETDHLNTELIVRAIDDELSAAERIVVEAHLSQCGECESRHRELAVLSVRVESLVAGAPVNFRFGSRDDLQRNMERVSGLVPATSKLAPTSLRVRGGMAIAAALALGLVFVPYHRRTVPALGATASSAAAASTFEVEGETFVSLPYSNSDLPVSTPKIVRMQMPVSSLTDAGLVFEPVSNEASHDDRSILADVLLGADGEPLGVHVVSTE